MKIIKKFWKELSVFGIVIVCILGLYLYRVATSAEYTTISLDKLETKIANGDDFVLVTGAQDTVYQTTIETYLQKHRSSHVYYLDLSTLAEGTVLPEGINNDTANAHTYIYIDGALTETRDGSIGYFTFDKVMTNFKEQAK